MTAHDYHSPPYHVSETRVRATGVSQPGSGWTRLLDAEADEIGGTFERDRFADTTTERWWSPGACSQQLGSVSRRGAGSSPRERIERQRRTLQSVAVGCGAHQLPTVDRGQQLTHPSGHLGDPYGRLDALTPAVKINPHGLLATGGTVGA